MPYPDSDGFASAARGLDESSVQDDARVLSWMGLVAVTGDHLAITPPGRAAYFEAECSELSARLAEVNVFADEIERRSPSLAAELHALRQIAEGVWSVDEATEYVERRAELQ